MQGTTHMFGGAAAALTVMTLTGVSEFQTIAVGTALGVLGGLLPDTKARHPDSGNEQGNRKDSGMTALYAFYPQKKAGNQHSAGADRFPDSKHRAVRKI